MSYLTSLEKRAAFPLRPAEQEEDVEVAEIETPEVSAAPAPSVPQVEIPKVELPPISDMLPREGKREKYDFNLPDTEGENPFDVAFGSRENLASLYAEVVDTTAKQRYEAAQLAEKYNRGEQEEPGFISGTVKEAIDTVVPGGFTQSVAGRLLSDPMSFVEPDKREVLERSSVDTYMLEADEDVPGLRRSCWVRRLSTPTLK